MFACRQFVFFSLHRGIKLSCEEFDFRIRRTLFSIDFEIVTCDPAKVCLLVGIVSLDGWMDGWILLFFAEVGIESIESIDEEPENYRDRVIGLSPTTTDLVTNEHQGEREMRCY